MTNILLRGHYIKDGVSWDIPASNMPSNSHVLLMLDILNSGSSGVFVLENNLAQDKVEPKNLTLYYENKKYLLMLLDFDEEGYIDVRTLFNPNAEKKVLEIMQGDPYYASTIVDNFEIIKQCFIEFNNTGNVSEDIMW